jgi:methionyl-tRNA formyltransferase
LRPDLLVLADYGRIVPGTLLALPVHGALNLHPSLLPRHRGATPIPAAILAGDAETGVSLIRMDEGVDTGPIVAQDHLRLRGDETAPELESVLAGLGARLLVANLSAWLSGALEARPQSEGGVTLTRPFRREDGLLDPAEPAIVLERRVRALQPWPGTWLDLPDGRLIVRRATLAAPPSDAPAAAPGLLLPTPDGVVLATGEGWLGLVEVQPGGGRPMSGAAWRHGRRDLPVRATVGRAGRPSGVSALG